MSGERMVWTWPDVNRLRIRLEELAGCENEAELRWALGEWITELGGPTPGNDNPALAELIESRKASLSEVCAECGHPRGHTIHWLSASGFQACPHMTGGHQ